MTLKQILENPPRKKCQYCNGSGEMLNIPADQSPEACDKCGGFGSEEIDYPKWEKQIRGFIRSEQSEKKCYENLSKRNRQL